MPHIDSTKFGSVTIDKKKYNQVLIIGDSVIERDYDKLKKIFGTSHKIGNWEAKELFKKDPELIVIGTGQSGAMEPQRSIINKFKNKGIGVIAESTPEAIKLYNQKMGQGRKVNALIHTTC
ncbi:MAG: Mth938-like domain-containing protein [Atribacterota bacterium]